jgi:ABC-type dipeptide/oligopeptide/nickel transport system permease subunit
MYRYWVLLHIAGVLAFMAIHGVSMFTMFRIRHLELDRARISDAIAFSGTTTTPMYVSLAVLVIAGFVAGYQGKWLDDWWIWIAVAVLVISAGLMTALAAPYFRRITEACGVRPSGVPRTSDEELTSLLHGSTTTLITAIGSVSLLIILYLMIFKPGQTF